jgi:tRNA(fMet)-specific endonuclease VapC
MRYLLDTNILSDLVYNPQGRIADRIRVVGESNVCTSIISAAELRFGAVKRQSPRLSAQVEAVLNSLEILPFETPADLFYAELRSHLERQGQPISANDMFIAAQSLALGHLVVTANQREFRRVPGLLVENWLAD